MMDRLNIAKTENNLLSPRPVDLSYEYQSSGYCN